MSCKNANKSILICLLPQPGSFCLAKHKSLRSNRNNYCHVEAALLTLLKMFLKSEAMNEVSRVLELRMSDIVTWAESTSVMHDYKKYNHLITVLPFSTWSHRPSAAWSVLTTCLLLTGKCCTTWGWYTWPCSSMPQPSTSSVQPSIWTLEWGNFTCCWQVQWNPACSISATLFISWYVFEHVLHWQKMSSLRVVFIFRNVYW